MVIQEPQPGPRGVQNGDFAASLAPIAAFLVANRFGGLRLAIVAATAVAVLVGFRRRRRGVDIGRLMPLVTGAVVLRGVVGVATDSEGWYFGLGIASKFALAVALAVSIALGRPLADRFVGQLLGVAPALRRHPRWTRTMALLSAIAALYLCVAGLVDIWLFRRSSVEGFIALRFVTNWPLGIAAVGAGVWVCTHQFRKIPGMAPLHELLDGPTESSSHTET